MAESIVTQANYQIMPDLSAEEFAELKTDIAARGVLVPVEYDENGVILDGHHRIKACHELGITTWPRLIRTGLTEEQKRSHARALNLARRHLSQEQRRSLIQAELKDRPQVSDRTIARELGVSQPTVSATRKEMVAEGELINFISSLGADGKERPRQVERKPRTVYIPETEEPKDVLVLKNTGDEEWWTPEIYLQAVREVLGAIDLDPASNDGAQETVKAATYYTLETDGLSKEWRGRVWMNPPYTSRVINQFVEKLANHYRDGDITAAIALTNNSTDTTWFQYGAKIADAYCFTAGRIRFVKPDNTPSSPLQGQVFLYFGPNVDAFKNAFSVFGLVMVKA